MFKLLSQLLDLIYKKRCYFCRSAEYGEKMCENCYKKIRLLPYKILKNINGVNVFCATSYAGNMQKLIRGIKYHNQKELAYYQAKKMFEYWKKLTISEDNFIVVPVPLFAQREKKRKYNQMLLVANEFSKLTDGKCVVENNLIKRVKNTKPQYKLTRKEREDNLKNAFELCDGYEDFKDKRVLIIDDIFTTGSTLKEMILTFQNHGFNELCCFVSSTSEHNLK